MQSGRPSGHGNQARRAFRFLAFFLFLTALAGAAPLHLVEAREPGGGRRALAPLLDAKKPLRIGVVGDSLATDLANGLRKVLTGKSGHTVVKFTRPATSLMRDDVYDWGDALDGFLGKVKLDVVAVIIGGNDRQSIWKDGDRLDHHSPAWRAEYELRLARFMNALKKSGASVYWVGLPVVRSDEMSRDYRRINEIQRAQARRHGFTYVSLWEAFADAKGGYTSFGPSVDGVKKRLRKNDGMHFTIEGELRLAHIVARAIAGDVNEIKPVH